MVQTPKRYKANGTEDDYKVDINSSSKKCNKPLMERRRRARINDSLNQLKSLVLQANGKEESNFSKLDKADILEMTVKHIAAIQHNSIMGSPSTISNSSNQFAGGFSACAKETLGLLSTLSDVTGNSAALQAGLFNHLTHAPCSPNAGTVSPEHHGLSSYSQQQQRHHQQNHVMNSPYDSRLVNPHHATFSEDARATYPASHAESHLNLRMPVLQKLSNNNNAGFPVRCGASRSHSYTVSMPNPQVSESQSKSACTISQPTTSSTYSQHATSSHVQVKQEPDNVRDYDENLRDYSDSASEGSRSPCSEDSSPTSSKAAWRPW
ncbi:protein hairy-like [Liolophura sinensis]|uniref:protein hairy-like n=1 Tax=Liolophura sinensis TaxID=3198878 RepID=UPI003158CF86